jgi:hypothetical protein
VAGLLNRSPYGGGLLGQRSTGLLGGQPTFASMYPGVGMNTPSLPSYEESYWDRMTRALPDAPPVAIASGILGGMGDLAMQANEAMPWGGNNPQAIGYDPQSGTIDPSVMVPFAQNVAGMATTGSLAAPAVRNATGMGIRAYHGSPHDFDRFSMDKIGTGEGAQAYGHGLYFAESPDVAKSYRDALSTPRSFKTDAEGKAFAYLKSAGGDVDAALSDLDARQRYMSPAAFAETKAYLTDIKSGKIAPPKTDGHTYEVDINASPDEFLDWDKPLSEQPKAQAALGITPDVLKALEEHHQNPKPRDAYDPEMWRLMKLADDDPRGSTIAGSSPQSAEALRAAGIKGIRYKDAGSRTAEGGTSNYVVFDDNTINILKKYGIAGLTAGGAGAAMLGGSSDSASAEAPSYSTGGRF